MPDAAAGPHPFETAGGQQARRSVRVFIADAAFRNIGQGGDAGMWMEPETGKGVWFSLSVEEVKEYEGFQKMAKVGWRHQSRDRPVILSAGASSDAGNRILLHYGFGQRTSSGYVAGFFVVGFQVRHGLSFLRSVVSGRLLSFASCLQCRCPPQQVLDHGLGLRPKLGESFVHVAA